MTVPNPAGQPCQGDDRFATHADSEGEGLREKLSVARHADKYRFSMCQVVNVMSPALLWR